MSLLSHGNSWDETLYGPSQITFNNALGLQVFGFEGGGFEWTLDPSVPGSERVSSTAFSEPISGNLTGEGETHTGALFYNRESCHTQSISNVCVNRYVQEIAPVSPLNVPVAFPSPICLLHAQAGGFFASLLAGAEHGAVAAPSGDCAAVYGE